MTDASGFAAPEMGVFDVISSSAFGLGRNWTEPLHVPLLYTRTASNKKMTSF